MDPSLVPFFGYQESVRLLESDVRPRNLWKKRWQEVMKDVLPLRWYKSTQKGQYGWLVLSVSKAADKNNKNNTYIM